MLVVGIRELKSQASELVRRVREEGISVEVTHHGLPVARLVPVAPPPPAEEEIEALLVDLQQLAAEVGRQWQGGSAVEAVREGRRDL